MQTIGEWLKYNLAGSFLSIYNFIFSENKYVRLKRPAYLNITGMLSGHKPSQCGTLSIKIRFTCNIARILITYAST
jgi:hypothetical protein